MIIDNLPVLPSKPTTGDEIAIERGQSTYKVDYDNMVGNSLSAIESSIAIIVSGNTTSTTIAAGQYVYIKGSTILTEGLYTANTAVPSGTTVSSTYFAPVSGGGLNAIQQSMAKLKLKVIDGTTDSSGYINLGLSVYQIPVWATGVSQSKILRFTCGTDSGAWGGFAICNAANTQVTFTCWYLDYSE